MVVKYVATSVNARKAVVWAYRNEEFLERDLRWYYGPDKLDEVHREFISEAEAMTAEFWRPDSILKFTRLESDFNSTLNLGRIHVQEPKGLDIN